MSIQISTRLEIEEPWLLDSTSLQELDTIISSHADKLEERRNRLIDEYAKNMIDTMAPFGGYKTAADKKKSMNEIKKRPPYGIKDTKKKLTLILDNGRKYISDTFSSTIKDPILADQEVKKFSLELESGDISLKLENNFWGDKLSLTVEPENTTESKEIFMDLRNWMEKNKAPKWQRVSNLSIILLTTWLLTIAISLLIWSFIGTNSLADAKQRAKEIINQGVDDKNANEAIELLLVLQTEYDPHEKTETKLVIPRWAQLILVSWLLISILVGIKPKTILSIGKGQNKIYYWRLWNKFIFVTIPGFVFAWFIAPYIADLINKLIN